MSFGPVLFCVFPPDEEKSLIAGVADEARPVVTSLPATMRAGLFSGFFGIAATSIAAHTALATPAENRTTTALFRAFIILIP